MSPRAAFFLGQLMVLTLLRQPDHACLTQAATPVLCTQCYPLLSPTPPTCTLPDPPRLLFKEAPQKEHSSDVPSSSCLAVDSDRSPEDGPGKMPGPYTDSMGSLAIH